MTSSHDLHVLADFYSTAEAEILYRRFIAEHHWPENRYQVAGRQFILPRLQTWHADPGIHYSYSHNLLETRAWTPLLSGIRNKIEAFLDFSFNAVLVNFYRDGADYVGWHADNEPELGEHPLIASLSFGCARPFAYRHKKTTEQGEVLLRNGSLLVMQPHFQQYWLHSIPKVEKLLEGRVNLTFRKVIRK